MKFSPLLKRLFIACVLFFTISADAQNAQNWTKQQLVEPSELANSITSQKNIPVIISVGPGALIPGSIDAGMASTPEGLEKFKKELKNINRNTKLVIYCGCCPFEYCPNVRPAIDVLKERKFTHYFLLDLPNNIKKDWIDKGFPVKKL